jgi:hypothetical protein
MRHFGIRFRGLLLFLMTAGGLWAQAPEGGMWMPGQLSKLDTLALKDLGLQLSTSDLYSQSQPSIKDGVVSFGGFCTGAFISGSGLLITNHHCAYGAIESHNMRSRNLLEDGFWASDMDEELANPGLEVTLLVHQEEVTRQILGTLKDNGSPEHKQRAIAERCKVLAERYEGKTGLQAEIRSSFGGNAWHVYLTRTFKDVRLVGAPPVSIARFGGDAAGREWPLHIADFAIFRVYADSNNAPAAYSESNQPYQPGHVFRLSIAPIEKGQLTIVAGFPGKSSLFLSSYGIRERAELYNPTKIRLHQAMLATLRPEMEKSRHLKSKYGTLYASNLNSMVSLQGELRGLKKLDVIGQRLEEEIKLAKWVESSPEKHAYYGDILRELRIIYLRRERLLRTGIHLEAVLSQIGLLDFANEWRMLGDLKKEDVSPKIIGQRARQLQKITRVHYKSYAAALDEKLCVALFELFFEQLPRTQMDKLFPEIEKKYGQDIPAWVADIYRKSRLVTSEKSLEWLRDFSPKDLRRLRRDPGYDLMDRLVGFYNEHYQHEWETTTLALEDMQGRYEAALLQMKTGKPSAPDANGTLRYSFGQIDDYQPEDGVRYRYCTTSKGILEKYKLGDEDYKLPKNYVEMLQTDDLDLFGQKEGVIVNFLATNHTTSGNSGSPVLDGKGYLIGINSTRTQESAASDFIYDRNEIRNVVVDTRYIMFVIARLAPGKSLHSELMNLCFGPPPAHPGPLRVIQH